MYVKDITYCSEGSCPFTDCMRHTKQLEGLNVIITLSNLTSVCDRYIAYTNQEESK